MSSLFQNANYIGNNISAILYGIELIVYGVTVYALWTKPKRGRSDTFFFCFSTSLLILLTIFYSTDAVFGEEMYVVNANYPGGMDAYLAKYVNVWYQTLSTASPITANLLGDGLMIYRCYIIYNNVYIIVIPSLIWLGTFAAGILLLYASGNPNGNFFGGFAANCGLAYYTTEISLNFITTVLIIGRLLWISRYMGRNLGPATSETYVNAIAIVVESALPYTICGIVYLVTYGVQSDISVLFLAIYGMMTGLSPQLIIMRVVKGRAVTKRHVTQAMTNSMAFADNNTAREVVVSRYAGDTMTAADTSTAFSIQLQNMSKAPSAAELCTKV